MPFALLPVAVALLLPLVDAFSICLSGCDHGEYKKGMWHCECNAGWEGRCCSKANCQAVNVVTDVDLDEWTRATWYPQAQQLTGYQPADSLYCIAATYSRNSGARVPFFNGEVIAVSNYANVGKVNGPLQNANDRTLCARLGDPTEPGKLSVAPCFLPNLFAGPYWIMAIGRDARGQYEWAIVIGGQPTDRYADGCTTKTTGINGAGLWLFTRTRVASDQTIQKMKDVLKEQDISTSQLRKVQQSGCTYEDAAIKP